jgi:hypothetical protein
VVLDDDDRLAEVDEPVEQAGRQGDEQPMANVTGARRVSRRPQATRGGGRRCYPIALPRPAVSPAG